MNNPQTTINPQKMCQKHSQSVTFICSFQNCKDHRYICEKCKLKDTLHFSHHGPYIYSVKEFYQFDNSKLLLPRLQKGVTDCETYINNHKQNYKSELNQLKQDFKSIKDQFLQISERFQHIYVEQFSKEMNKFDEKMLSVKALFRQYSKQKSSQDSFFTMLFSNEASSHNKSLEDILTKNAKAFKIRADIIGLRSDIAQAKISTSKYKGSRNQEARFLQLKQYFVEIVTGFYNRLKDFLSVSNMTGNFSLNMKSSTRSDQEQQEEIREKDSRIFTKNRTNPLKQSIISQTKSLTSLATSRAVESQSLVNSKNAPLRSNSLINDLSESSVSNRSLKNSFMGNSQTFKKQKTNLTQPHPIVQKIISELRPLPAENPDKSNQGPYKYHNGVYFGQYQGNQRNGQGSFVFNNGCYYEGSWQKDIMSGYGRLISTNCFYEGQIKDGKAHGKGVYQDAERTYNGEWIQDKRHGLGEEEFKKGKKRKYVGLFSNDKYEGRGKLVDQDFYYQGTFQDGLFHGQNCLIKYYNGEVYQGYFDNGCKHFGKHNFIDGSCYQGKFINDIPHGPGDFYWPDGIIYSGQWKQGKQDGVGKMSFPDGRVLNGIWKNGNWVKWI